MALLQIRIRSRVLATRTEIHVALPLDRQDVSIQGQKLSYQVVYMLHGGAGDASVWLRETSAERYARERNVALVFPDAGGHSYYTDMRYGRDYWAYISEELPALMAAMLPLSTKREDTFVAGYSMGGYGAYKCALLHPERFACAAALSGAFDLERILSPGKSSVPERARSAIFGDPPRYDPETANLYAMLLKLKESGASIPALYSACGTEDPLTWECHTHMSEFCQTNDIPLTVRSLPGKHDFAFWDPMTEELLDWLPLKRAPIYT